MRASVCSSGKTSGAGAAPRQRCRAAGAAGGGASQQAAAAEALTFRPATDTDMEACRRLVLSEKMNPLGLDQRRLVVAASQSGAFLGMGQLVPLGPGLSEVRSVVVAPEHRGRGVGEALVRHLCAQSRDPRVVLTTISRRRAFYARAGFREVPLSAVPREMLFEVAAGTVAARLFANDSLVVMSLDKGAP